MDLRARSAALQDRLNALVQQITQHETAIRQHDAALQQARAEAMRVGGQLDLVNEQLAEDDAKPVRHINQEESPGKPRTSRG